MCNFQSSNLILSFFLILTIGFISGCSNSSENALQYHQRIQTEVLQVKAEYVRLSELLGSRDKPAIQIQAKKLKTLVSNAIQRLNKIPQMSNDFEYKALAIKQLQVLEENLEMRYPKIIDLISMGDLKDEQAEQLEIIYDKIEDLEEPLFEQFEQTSVRFSKHYQLPNRN